MNSPPTPKASRTSSTASPTSSPRPKTPNNNNTTNENNKSGSGSPKSLSGASVAASSTTTLNNNTVHQHQHHKKQTQTQQNSNNNPVVTVTSQNHTPQNQRSRSSSTSKPKNNNTKSPSKTTNNTNNINPNNVGGGGSGLTSGPTPFVITPEERSRIAREKFQSLMQAANRVKQQVGRVPSSTLQSPYASSSGTQKPGQALKDPPPKPSRSTSNVNNSPSKTNSASLVKAYPSNVNVDPLRSFPPAKGSPSVLPPVNIMKPILLTKSALGMERSKNIRAFVEKAMQERKVFVVLGMYPAIKNALKKRGWIEKTGPTNMSRSVSAGPRLTSNGTDEESDSAWISRVLRDYPPDFLWVIRRDNIDWKNINKEQIINRYPKAWFTTKVGIAACLQQMHWYSEAGFSETFFPRCYRLSLEDERLAFQEDFRLTACMGYLRHFVEMYESKGSSWLVDPQSRITPLSIDFASRQLGNYIRMRRHEDIDWLLPPNFMSQHWDAFIHQYYMVVGEKKKIRFESVEGVKIKYDVAKKTLQRISQYWPQYSWDGTLNMWICKPGARSRGNGIVILNQLDKILELQSHGNSREANWVVQKYMERPMLIYKTKFDVRQWFIITDWTPLTIWFYKESYIRFSSKPYDLSDFHESVHLTNNAIQCRYKNDVNRDSALPEENMWDCYTFQSYLKTVGKLEQWPRIYNGMKQALIGVLLASQENVETRKNCFELYGADFMLSEDLTPWLIEINSCPCMASTTSITARMCAECLEDTIKVVVDRRHNRNADTGKFELIYKQPQSAITISQFTGHDLAVTGKKLTRDLDWPGHLSTSNTKSLMNSTNNPKRSSITTTTGGLNNNNIKDNLTTHLSYSSSLAAGPTFADLLTRLRMKNTELFQSYMQQGTGGTNKDDKNKEILQNANAILDPSAGQTFTGTLLARMKSLNNKEALKDNKEDLKDPSKDKSLAKSTSTNKNVLMEQGTLSHLSKYFEENSTTFANLVRIGREIKAEQGGQGSGSGKPLDDNQNIEGKGNEGFNNNNNENNLKNNLSKSKKSTILSPFPLSTISGKPIIAVGNPYLPNLHHSSRTLQEQMRGAVSGVGLGGNNKKMGGSSTTGNKSSYPISKINLKYKNNHGM